MRIPTLAFVFLTLAFVFLTLASACLADGERPKMLPPPPEEEAVKDLLGTLSSACSEKNFRRYIGCFTPDKTSHE